jgi:hypothetical protein
MRIGTKFEMVEGYQQDLKTYQWNLKNKLDRDSLSHLAYFY